MSDISSGVAASLMALMFCLGVLFGLSTYGTIIDADCKNVGKSYTTKHVLTCEAKK